MIVLATELQKKGYFGYLQLGCRSLSLPLQRESEKKRKIWHMNIITSKRVATTNTSTIMSMD
jgi:hypothetical protein